MCTAEWADRVRLVVKNFEVLRMGLGTRVCTNCLNESDFVFPPQSLTFPSFLHGEIT